MSLIKHNAVNLWCVGDL